MMPLHEPTAWPKDRMDRSSLPTARKARSGACYTRARNKELSNYEETNTDAGGFVAGIRTRPGATEGSATSRPHTDHHRFRRWRRDSQQVQPGRRADFTEADMDQCPGKHRQLRIDRARSGRGPAEKPQRRTALDDLQYSGNGAGTAGRHRVEPETGRRQHQCEKSPWNARLYGNGRRRAGSVSSLHV